MSFITIDFAVFLSIVFILYWFVFRSLKSQNLLIVVASYIFYGSWDWRFLALIGGITLCSYLSGILIEKNENNEHTRRGIHIFNIIVCIGTLFVFKYFDFFIDNFFKLFNKIGLENPYSTIHIILPVGISFYTFQALSYTIDIYQRKIKPTHDIVSFFAFVSFFPQLVAGPIEKASHLLPQFFKERNFDYGDAVTGMKQILWGLFKKVMVADNCAFIVNNIFCKYQDFDGFTLFLGGFFFAFQIYGDFSGYSDIAIGTARLFGIKLKQNFRYPYFASNPAELWQRWHISLMTWLKDYIYIPLGGSRCSITKHIRNIFIVFLVSGLWHGANWTFVCWGLYHAILLIPTLYIKNKNISFNKFAGCIITFVLFTFGAIIFRSESVSQSIDYIYRIFSEFEFVMPMINYRALISIVVMLCIEWINRNKSFGLEFTDTGIFKYRLSRWMFFYILIFLMINYSGYKTDFIYFQF